MEGYTYQNLYLAARNAIRAVDDPQQAEFAAREIVAAASGRTVGQLVADFPLAVFDRDIAQVQTMVERYIEGEPLPYILGQWNFYGLDLTVSPDVLIPRDDTEAVTSLAISKAKLLPQNPRILDLCAGSGCIGLAIASKVKDARVTLGELSKDAIRIAKKNIQDHHLSGRVSCIQLDALKEPPAFLGKYDLIVSNPPYITAGEMTRLAPSVRKYEPEMALYGGEDGLDFYRAIVKNYGKLLKPGKFLCFEFGMGQEDGVCAILQAYGYTPVQLVRDTGDRVRAVLAKKPDTPEADA